MLSVSLSSKPFRNLLIRWGLSWNELLGHYQGCTIRGLNDALDPHIVTEQQVAVYYVLNVYAQIPIESEVRRFRDFYHPSSFCPREYSVLVSAF